MSPTSAAKAIEFINGIVVTFDLVQAGSHYEVRPRLDAYPHSLPVRKNTKNNCGPGLGQQYAGLSRLESG